MKRLRLSLVVVVIATAVASCAKSGPLTLSLATSQSRTGEVRMNADSSFTEPEALPVVVTYSVQGTLPYLGDRLLAWSIGRRTKPSGELEKLAFSFGINGDVEKIDENMYAATDVDKTKSVNLWIDDAGGWWSYSNFEQGTGSGVSEPSCPPDMGCDVPAPAQNLPQNLIEPGDALRRTNQYLSRADMVPLNYPLKATKSDYSTDVFGALTLGGVETNIGVSFTYGENGVLLSASGPMIAIAMAGRYPIVSPMEAVKRLSDPLYGAIGGAVRGAADVAVSSQPAEDSVTNQEIDIPITGVRLILMEARLSNGTHMLLPAYTFSNADGDVGTVIAISNDLLAFRKSVTDSTAVAPTDTSGTGTEPAPVEPGAISQAEANSLIGLTEREATLTAGGKDWLVRIAVRDGKFFMLTTDYVTNRVNLTIEKTLVTAVTVG
jgi:hypothetical protein